MRHKSGDIWWFVFLFFVFWVSGILPGLFLFGLMAFVVYKAIQSANNNQNINSSRRYTNAYGYAERKSGNSRTSSDLAKINVFLRKYFKSHNSLDLPDDIELIPRTERFSSLSSLDVYRHGDRVGTINEFRNKYGEAYDKVARVLGLGYPGGPVVDKLAKNGKPHYSLPTPKTSDPYNFSFSGLKTAVLQLKEREERKGNVVSPEDLVYAFQETALTTMVSKTIAAVKEYKPKMIVLAGGVAANSRLREMMKEEMSKVEDTELLIPPMWCCTDNAAMIGASGQIAYNHKCFGDLDAAADPNMLMPGEK